MLLFAGDNATSNDTQTTELASHDNSFEEDHHIRCFNHTLNLGAKSILRPFLATVDKVKKRLAKNKANKSSAASKEKVSGHGDGELDAGDGDDDEMPELEEVMELFDLEDMDKDVDERPNANDGGGAESDDDGGRGAEGVESDDGIDDSEEGDGLDELRRMSSEGHAKVLEDTKAARVAMTKVCSLFSLFISTP